ncbi:GNAT family N-acetyltransferase [Candidatus Bathyarchaeota archaeon]|nr:GNAT family N-acetyltransferase [Candidatus Bathyarchaeota archaeon]
MARKHETFRIHKVLRRFDRHSGKFVINVSFETSAPEPTDRVVATAEAFGLGLDRWERFTVFENVDLKIGLKDVVYITGDSGSGKSVLLRALEKDIKRDLKLSSINLNDVKPDVSKPLIETVGESVEEGLELLARVGLGDAFLFLRTFNELSDGQKYRYKIAKMIESSAQFWILDEFAATLDRDTAKVVAWNLQKIARSEGKCVLAATTHKDLLLDLNPDVHVHKRFGKEIRVVYYPNPTLRVCSLVGEMKVVEGCMADWRELACFHYRSHRLPAPRKIFCLKRGEELCGVIVYCYPSPACFGRRQVLPKLPMRELNKRLSVISRVVIHPKYRSLGLGAGLIRETLDLCGTDFVELVAVMAKYNPFAERAGMRKVALEVKTRQVLALAEVLESVGLDRRLFGSVGHVKLRLKAMSKKDLDLVRAGFIRHKNGPFLKVFFSAVPFGHAAEYGKCVEKASVEKLARLIKACGFLLQEKVYLFYSKPAGSG